MPAFIARHGGCYLVRGAVPEVIEGDWAPERMVILKFPAKENAKACLSDPDFQGLIALRKASTISRLVLVGGL